MDSDYEGYQSSESELSFNFEDDNDDDDNNSDIEILYEEFYNEKEISNRIIPKKTPNQKINKVPVKKAGKMRVKKRNQK
jgi:hypothetical protein